MTTLQNAMLKNIAKSDFTDVNGSEPRTLDDVGNVWADDVISSAEDKGVFTSLLRAGLVEHQAFANKRDNTVSLTQAGFDAYKAIAAKSFPKENPMTNFADFVARFTAACLDYVRTHSASALDEYVKVCDVAKTGYLSSEQIGRIIGECTAQAEEERKATSESNLLAAEFRQALDNVDVTGDDFYGKVGRALAVALVPSLNEVVDYRSVAREVSDGMLIEFRFALDIR